MWIFAVKGFVSVVQVRGTPGQMMVRGRRREDVEAWSRLVGGMRKIKLINTPRADYPWRFITSRKAFALAVVKSIGELNYSNFKDEVGYGDHSRARAYHDVWATMRML